MHASQRREAIMTAVFERGTARTRELAESLGVSEVTIRTDFEVLERQGRVARVHGGVTMSETPLMGFDARSSQNVEAKQRIGAAAAALVTDGTTIILDSGTTIFALARHLPGVSDLVVLTPGVNIALALMDVSGIQVRLLGGRLVPHIAATVGSPRQQGLEGEIAHVAFLGAGGMDADHDVVEGSLDIAESKRSLVTASRRRVLLADSAKWFTLDRHKVVNVSRFDTVVTDDAMPVSTQDAIRATGAELILA
ncbi:DeoR/GlpR family DNA-binding transcription regulator [Pseudactinotalea suaedae]|uniref:DeoR/GlpR family DNA-binding transcription regulator n=1 Tax=Pseudactinotalea suaedae TaxID=1524924 RepID=UPI0012E29AA4|nr:DeoR/GlpR family DNA-binding transcription regulator [Pseudactinotalea suaedae]